MFVLLELQGLQYKTSIGDFLYVNYINKKVGEYMVLKNVLLHFKNVNDIRIGNPFVQDVSINIEILKHVKSDKILIFKKKRRKGYKVKNGHRQLFTKIKILSIN